MEHKKRIRFTTGDTVVIFAALLTAALLFLIPLLFSNQSAELVVSVNGSEQIYDLNTDRSFIVENEGVVLQITTKDGEAYVELSTCRDGVCRNSAKISRPGQSIICAPAKVALTVRSREVSSDEDAVAG